MSLIFFNLDDAARISIGMHRADTYPREKLKTRRSQKPSLVFGNISKLKYLARDSPLTYTASRVDDPGQDRTVLNGER